MTFKPVFNLRSVTIRKAFILNAIVLAFIAPLSNELRRYLDIRKETKDLSEIRKIAITVVGTFFIGIFIYVVIRFFFGFGEGLLANKPFSRKLI